MASSPFETVVRTGLQRLRDGAEVQVLNDPDAQPGAEGQSG